MLAWDTAIRLSGFLYEVNGLKPNHEKNTHILITNENIYHCLQWISVSSIVLAKLNYVESKK